MKPTPILIGCLLTACAHHASVGTEPKGTALSQPTTSAQVRPPSHPTNTPPVATLTWQFSRTLGNSDGGPERDIDVIVRVGESENRVALSRHHGSLIPSQQSVCDSTLKNSNVVSLIHLHTMGEETIVARRVTPELLEISFTVDADDEPAKLQGVLGTMAIPAQAGVVDQIRMAQDDGTLVSFDCASTAWRDE